MPIKFNPLSGQFDLVNAVPTPPVTFDDSTFRIYDDADATKQIAFEASAITTGTTRTLTSPNADGRIQVEGQAIGDVTPAAGTFTKIIANNGTLTASNPVLSLSQTWNNAAVSFVGLSFDITNTASAFGLDKSKMLSLSVEGNNVFSVYRSTQSSNTANAPEFHIGSSGFGWRAVTRTGGGTGINAQGIIAAYGLQLYSGTGTGAGDVQLNRDAADALAMYRTTNFQSFRIYKSFTTSTNYERAFVGWKVLGGSDIFEISSEFAGTGIIRRIEMNAEQFIFRISGTEYVRLNTSGLLTFGGNGGTFPAIKRSGTDLQVRTATDSDYMVMDAKHRMQGAAPATATDAGTAGDIIYDADHIYVCTATNTWKRVAIATF